MICPQCKTRNPIGNKFCRECGARLDAPDDTLAVEEAARAEAERREERVAVLLAEAIALADEEKPHEALARAEEATHLIPGSTSAQALLASLYERTGQTPQAIRAMETVVALNPESHADREKLDQLRRGVHVLPVPVRAGTLPAWTPLVAAGAATALVLGLGLRFLLNDENDAEQRLAARSALAPGQTAPAVLPANTGRVTDTVPLPNRPDPFEPASGGPASGGATAAPPPSPQPTTARTERRVSATSASALPTLPAPREGSTSGVSTPPRFRFRPGTTGAPRSLPPLDSGGYIAVAPPAAASGGERIRVTPPASAPAASQGPAAPSQERPSGYIRIRVGPPVGGGSSGRATPPPASSDTGDPLLRAQSLQAAGRYGEAAASYRQALGSLSGSAAGEAYQSLALCEQRQGNTEAARAAYSRAITAYEAASGSEVARQGIASCRAALEVLGNG